MVTTHEDEDTFTDEVEAGESYQPPPFPSHIDNSQPCQICHRFGHTAGTCYHRTNAAYTATHSPYHTSNWCLDTGATHHITSQPSTLNNVSPYNGHDSVTMGDGSQMPISHVGSSSFSGCNKNFHLNNILCIPTAHKSLLSIRRFSYDNHCYFEFDAYGFCVKDLRTKKILFWT